MVVAIRSILAMELVRKIMVLLARTVMATGRRIIEMVAMRVLLVFIRGSMKMVESK